MPFFLFVYILEKFLLKGKNITKRKSNSNWIAFSVGIQYEDGIITFWIQNQSVLRVHNKCKFKWHSNVYWIQGFIYFTFIVIATVLWFRVMIMNICCTRFTRQQANILIACILSLALKRDSFFAFFRSNCLFCRRDLLKKQV